MSNQKGKMNIDQLLRIEQQKSTDRILTNILLLILAVIPLITRTAIFSFASPVISETGLDSGMKGDVFTYYKVIWLLIGVVILLAVFLYKMAANGYQIHSSYINGPLAVMFSFILLSGVFAEYKTLGMFGQYNRHEGTLTYLMYLVLFFVSANVVYTDKKANGLFYALYPLVAVNAILGLLYFYGVDLLKFDFFNTLLFPSDLPRSSISAGAHFNSTINNPNYISGIAGVLVILYLSKAVLDNDIKKSMVGLLFSVVAFAMLLTSLSTSGFVTFVFTLPFIVLALLFSSNRKRGTLIGMAAAIAFTGVFIILNSHNPQIWNESVGFFAGSSKPKLAYELDNQKRLDWEQFMHKHSPFSVEKALAADGGQQTEDEFNLPPQGWSAGTGRTYIWTKTINLIKEHPLFGYGLDTLSYYFPQDDPGKNSGINNPNMTVDKPHNMYLGIAFGSGVVALLAFLFLLACHAWKHVRLLAGRITTERRVIVASLFCAWCAYLIQALFNDSIIGTGFIFWILFGAAVSMLREEMTTEEQM